jgi:hypothetical protein
MTLKNKNAKGNDATLTIMVTNRNFMGGTSKTKLSKPINLFGGTGKTRKTGN